MSGINVTVVALLDVAVERILAQVQKVRVLVEAAPIAIVVMDEKGVIKLVNGSTEKQFGYHRLDLMGKRVEVLLAIPQVAEHREARERFLQMPEARAMGAGRNLSGRRKNGSEFPVEIGLNTISQNGRTAVLATIMDISDRKKAQDRRTPGSVAKNTGDGLMAEFSSVVERCAVRLKSSVAWRSAIPSSSLTYSFSESQPT